MTTPTTENTITTTKTKTATHTKKQKKNTYKNNKSQVLMSGFGARFKARFMDQQQH